VREPTIARNYAEALFDAGEHAGETTRYADLIEAVAGAVAADERVALVLESPRVPKEEKRVLLEKALTGRAPATFIRFLAAVVKRGRQGLIGGIAREFLSLVDVKFNRVHASVILTREPDMTLQDEIKKRLSFVMRQDVIPHYRADPSILGGVIVRVGDRVMDGSIRKKILHLRRRMIGAR
jgi:F-type H+-transporting ATPase subunit delta